MAVSVARLSSLPVKANDIDEAALKNRQARRQRWLARAWRSSARGNAFLNVRGRNVVVFAVGSSRRNWRVDGVSGDMHYESLDAAKFGAFEQVERVEELRP